MTTHTQARETAVEWDLPALVRASADHDEGAWNELVRRFAGLVAFVIRRHRLSGADAQDVSQLVWLHLVEHLGEIREPAALAGWLATTTRRECVRHLRANDRTVAVDPLVLTTADPAGVPEADDLLLAAELRQALRDGLAELAPRQRELLLMLTADPPYPYAEISRRLDIPIGSIGPTRRRLLDRLRDTGAVRTYLADHRAARAPSPGCGAMRH
jgi:RNA polymerase sigma factor (sigma-70 family)